MPDSSPKPERIVLGEEGPARLRRLPALEAAMRVGHWLTQRGVQVGAHVLDELLARASRAEIFVLDDAREGLVAWLTAHLETSLGQEKERCAAGALDRTLDGLAVRDARFRRAERVAIDWEAGATPRVTAPRAMTLPEEGLRVLCALTTWQTPSALAARLGLDPNDVAAWLVVFALHDLAIYADFPSERTFPGGPIDDDSRGVALLECALVDVVIDRGRGPEKRILMPRLGELEDVAAVGMSFAVHRRGERVGVVRLTGGAEVYDTLSAVVPLLDGSRSLEALAREAGPAVRALAAAGLLEAAQPVAPVARPPVSATWLGHASVLVSVGDTHVWIDPTLPLRHHEPRAASAAPSLRALPKPSAVLITHGDNDHLSPHWLTRIRRDTPIYFPSTEGAGKWQVDIRGVLRLLGFTDLRPMTAWERARIGEVEITATPFDGEDWGLPLRAVTWLVEGRGRRVYLSADAAGMLEHAERIRGGAQIDLAFLGVCGCVEPHVSALGYGNFYERWIPRERRMRLVRLTNGAAEAADLALALGARAAFGYAAGTPHFQAMAYNDEGSHEELRKILLARGATKPADLVLGVPYAL